MRQTSDKIPGKLKVNGLKKLKWSPRRCTAPGAVALPGPYRTVPDPQPWGTLIRPGPRLCTEVTPQ